MIIQRFFNENISGEAPPDPLEAFNLITRNADPDLEFEEKKSDPEPDLTDWFDPDPKSIKKILLEFIKQCY